MAQKNTIQICITMDDLEFMRDWELKTPKKNLSQALHYLICDYKQNQKVIVRYALQEAVKEAKIEEINKTAESYRDQIVTTKDLKGWIEEYQKKTKNLNEH